MENREGAGGNIGALAASQAAPDGYTFLVAQTTTFLVNQYLYRSFPIDPSKTFTPIIQLGNTHSVLLARYAVILGARARQRRRRHLVVSWHRRAPPQPC